MTGVTVPTVPSTIELRPSRLVAMLLAAVTLTAAVTWALTDLALDTSSGTRDAAPAVATSQQLHAAWAGTYAGRTVPTPTDHALAAATLAAGITPGAVSSPADHALAAATLAVGITPGAVLVSLTPEVVAPAYAAGLDDVARRNYAAALASLTPEIVAPAYSAAVEDEERLGR